jgi:hypothetical protein
VQLLLSTVAAERNGEMVDTSLMRCALSMLVDCGVESPQVYVEEFETDFLNDSENFYSKESFECLSKSTCPEYLVKVRACGVGPRAGWSWALWRCRDVGREGTVAYLHGSHEREAACCCVGAQVEKRIQEERARVRTYLNIITGPRLRSIVESILIEDKAETLVNVGAERRARVPVVIPIHPPPPHPHLLFTSRCWFLWASAYLGELCLGVCFPPPHFRNASSDGRFGRHFHDAARQN